MENPLEKIRAINAQKELDKQQADKSKIEDIVSNQENVDQEHFSLKGQKEVLVEEVESFKQKIQNINGTRGEMIAQYHEAINEAKKNPETLMYVKEHFA